MCEWVLETTGQVVPHNQYGQVLLQGGSLEGIPLAVLPEPIRRSIMELRQRAENVGMTAVVKSRL